MIKGSLDFRTYQSKIDSQEGKNIYENISPLSLVFESKTILINVSTFNILKDVEHGEKKLSE